MVKILKFFDKGEFNNTLSKDPIFNIISKIYDVTGAIARRLCYFNDNLENLDQDEANGIKFWVKSGFPVHESLNGNECTLQHFSVVLIHKLKLMFEN